MAIGFEDADGARRANAVGVHEHHDIAHGLLLCPSGDDLPGAEFADAGDLSHPLGLGLDNLEGLFAEGGHDPLGEDWPDTADHSGAEIFFDPLRCRRRRGLEEIGFELKPMGSVGDPDADSVDEFAGGDRRDVADYWDEVALSSRLHLKDGKPVILVVESHALDRADERFPRLCRVKGRLQRWRLCWCDGFQNTPERESLQLCKVFEIQR